MTPLDRALVFALLAQMATTVVVGVWLGRTRAVAVKAKEVRGDVMLSQEGWPSRARAASNNFSNQFEVPVLFYVLGLLALWAQVAGPIFVGLAWIFVASRIAHAIAHCGPNDLRFRAPAYFVGVAAVLGQMIALVVAVAAG